VKTKKRVLTKAVMFRYHPQHAYDDWAYGSLNSSIHENVFNESTWNMFH
jgi:hypothetical protein